MITLWLQGRQNCNRLTKVSFTENARVEVLGDRMIKPFVSTVVRHEEAIRNSLIPGSVGRTAEEICDLINQGSGEKAYLQSTKDACKELTRRGVLIRRKREVGNTTYRPLMPLAVGYPIVELYGARTERWGWIAAFGEIRGTGEVYPIAQWLNGIRSPVQESLIDPVSNIQMRARLDQAFKAQSAQINSKPEIPWELLCNLYELHNGRPRVCKKTLISIAQHLELMRVDRTYLSDATRNQVLTHLDLYYPQWRKIQGQNQQKAV